jgi:Family of unknown function (DUF6459)
MTTPRPQLSGHPRRQPPGPQGPEADPCAADPRETGRHRAELRGTEPDAAGPGGPVIRQPGLCRPDLPILPPFPRQPARPRPLPDVVAVRRMPLPDSAPPYDDQPGASQPGASQPGASQPGAGQPGASRPATSRSAPGRAGSGAGQRGPGQAGSETSQRGPGQAGSETSQPGPGQAGSAAAQPRPGQAGSGAGQPGPAQAGPGPGRSRPGQAVQPRLVPTPDAWPSQFAQALAEALAGARPPQQLASWTTQRARNRIRQLGPLLQAGPRPRVMRVVGCAPAGDVVELAVIVSVGPAVRALAIRLERAGQFSSGQFSSGQFSSGRLSPAAFPPGPLPPGRPRPGQLPPGGPGPASHDRRSGRSQEWLCTDIEAA